MTSEKEKSNLTAVENGSVFGTGYDVAHKKEVLVTLKQPRRGVYLSRVQLVLFTSAFILCILLVVLLLTFVRQDEITKVTSPTVLCNHGHELTGHNVNHENITVSFSDDIKNGSREVIAENLTYIPNENLSEKAQKSENDTKGILNDSNVDDDGLDQDHPSHKIRLSRDLIPEHYDIELLIDLSNKTYSGSVQMTLFAKQKTKYVVFHTNVIHFLAEDVSVKNLKTNKYLEIRKQRLYKANQFWVIELVECTDVGNKYLVEVREYFGYIRQDLKGLYLSTYVEDGVTNV